MRILLLAALLLLQVPSVSADCHEPHPKCLVSLGPIPVENSQGIFPGFWTSTVANGTLVMSLHRAGDDGEANELGGRMLYPGETMRFHAHVAVSERSEFDRYSVHMPQVFGIEWLSTPYWVMGTDGELERHADFQFKVHEKLYIDDVVVSADFVAARGPEDYNPEEGGVSMRLDVSLIQEARNSPGFAFFATLAAVGVAILARRRI